MILAPPLLPLPLICAIFYIILILFSFLELSNFAGGKIGTRKFNKDRDYLWPVPTVVLQNNTALEQNLGYGK
jgi:hypothetical protein